MKTKILALIGLVTGLVILPFRFAEAWSLEELAETFCEYYDGVSCDFETHEATYKFGSYHMVYKGNAKIRSQVAYCLLRDGGGEEVGALLGEDWYRSGANSRLHITFAGKDETGLYRAEGQHLMDLVLFDHTLRGIQVQDIATSFPTENAKTQTSTCRKWTKVGSTKICMQYMPSLSKRTAYYMTLNTNSYAWEIDVDEVASDLSQLFGGPPMPPGLEIAVGQDVPFEYYGTTELSDSDAILDDGLIPSIAYSGNRWEWGRSPDETADSTYLNVELPIVDIDFASLILYGNAGLDGFYALEEGPLVMDPDSGLLDTPPQVDELTTATYLETGTEISLVLEGCLDFGWFGEWCESFTLLNEMKDGKRSPMNIVAYTPRGLPLSSQWADGTSSEESRVVVDQLSACLSAAPIVQEAEEPATPADWIEFLDEVAGTVRDRFEPCFVTEPVQSVTVINPGFKLCDTDGNVYEPSFGFRKP